MLLPVLLLVFAALTVALYSCLRARRDLQVLWRSTVAIGSSLGIVRAVLACVDWYVVEHTGGPGQIQAFAGASAGR
jgi:hypothetical protein